MKKLVMLIAAAFVFSFFVYLLEVNKSLSFAGSPKEKKTAQNKKPEITAQVDKNFGYFVGDIATVRYKIKMPAENWKISEKDLPKAGEAIGQGLEIREIKMRQSKESGRQVITLEIKFQIFRVFKEPKNLSLPAIAFFYGPLENPRQRKSNLPAVEIKISPLCGLEKPMFQPFFELPTKSSQRALTTIFSGGILMIVGWFWFLKLIIDRCRHPSPFKEAIKKIKRTKPENYHEALLIFRHSLSQRLGQAIFSHNLTQLFQAIPRAKNRSSEISKIIELSDNLYFNPNFQPTPEMLFDLKKRLISELKYLIRSERWK